MDLKQAEYMIKIAETKNISKAADMLFLTQPALNQQLLHLEKELGTQIFFRSRTNWHLTPEGQVYLNNAKEMLRIKNDTFNQIQDMINSKKGHISIGFTPNRGSYMFSEIYNSFHKSFPDVTIEPVEVNVRQQQELIHSGDLDLGFVTLPENQKTDDSYIKLCTEELVMAVPKEIAEFYGIKDKTVLTIPELNLFKSLSFIMIFKKSTLRPIIEDIFNDAGFKPDILFETSVPSIILKMVNSSAGCGIIPKYHTHRIHPNVMYYSLSPLKSWDHYALYKRGSYLSQPSKELIRLAKDFLRFDTR